MNEQYPTHNNGQIIDKTPHAGGENVPADVREVPTTHYDNTTLEQAIRESKVNPKVDTGEIPTTLTAEAGWYPIEGSDEKAYWDGQAWNLQTLPQAQPSEQVEAAALVQPLEQPEATAETKKKSKVGLFAGIGAGVLALGAGTALTVGLLGGSSSNNEEAPEQPVNPGVEQVEEPQEPAETETPSVEVSEKTAEQLIEELKIEAGLPAEEYSERLMSSMAKWDLAGAEEYYKEWREADDPNSLNLEAKYADQNLPIFTTALFHPEWKNTLSILAEQSRERNEKALNAFAVARYLNEHDGTNLPDLQMDLAVTDVELISEDTNSGMRTMQISGHSVNNTAETANSESSNVQRDGELWSFNVTTVVVDGVEYVYDWSAN